MNAKHIRNPILLAAAVVATLLTSACGGAGNATNTPSALSTALAASTDAAGTLLCAPAAAQVDACTGLVAGDPCVLTPPNGTATVAGTCRTTIDGAAVACAPNPPAPPQELVDACSGKVVGNTCQVTEAFGDDTRDGVCVTARDGATLVCGRVHVPPQAAIDACATLETGAACAMPNHMGTGTVSGVCSLGPASTGPLACAPVKDLLPHGEQACAGLLAGASCTLGHRHAAVTGTCVVPAPDSAAVCVVACADLRGRFECGPRGPGGPGMGGMPGMPGHH